MVLQKEAKEKITRNTFDTETHIHTHIIPLKTQNQKAYFTKYMQSK